MTGWVVDTTTARLGFDIGFAVLDGTQHDMADRLPNIELDWLTQREHRHHPAGDRRDGARTRRPGGEPADPADRCGAAARGDRGGAADGVGPARTGGLRPVW